jgi:hypothetical protein
MLLAILKITTETPIDINTIKLHGPGTEVTKTGRTEVTEHRNFGSPRSAVGSSRFGFNVKVIEVIDFPRKDYPCQAAVLIAAVPCLLLVRIDRTCSVIRLP